MKLKSKKQKESEIADIKNKIGLLNELLELLQQEKYHENYENLDFKVMNPKD